MFDKIKEGFKKFDPKLKMLIMVMGVITIIVVFVFGEDPSEEVSYEEGQVEIAEIEDDYRSGRISSSAASSRSSGVRSSMGSAEDAMKQKYKNISNYTGLPGWAVEAGIPEVGGLTLVEEKSVIITPSETHTDSFAAVYSGSSRALIAEAKRISYKLDLVIVSETSYSFAAKGGVSNYSVVISVSSGMDDYQMKYGASKLKN